jgi:hypothetical protein
MDQKFDTTDHGTDGPKAFPAPNVETQYYDDASILMCQSFCYAAHLKATYGQPERGVVKWRKSLWGGRGFL